MKINFKQQLRHRKDVLLHRGFPYQGQVLYKSLSGALYLEEKRKNILTKLEEPIAFIIDSIKIIKRSYNWTLETDFINFN